ncbi:type IV toxin-antitoxin system AbiEi family antitoxin domain-containing protein [Archaeoglobus veneficus]|uniref:Uncharacterized protein n=2 Tax=root TaxID=1 RepID=F2KMG1_ARCVS|nr:type IV toxin-antitoxin system AbiEi family antitoxin [Archaeoglobus veneficus]AEA46060.1 hypothetical protein Arcve_0016 [Archaeoglobus veneficus SNP6]
MKITTMKKLTTYILSEYGRKVVKREELENVFKRFRKDASSTINYMTTYGYFIRILRGLYYVKSIEEFKKGKRIDTLKIISLGMEKLGVGWYFGLHTALRLNGLTHEYSAVIHVLSDSIYRPKDVSVNEDRVKFVKLKKDLFGFGVVERNGLKYSDLEKTLLDTVYLYRYRSVPEKRIISILREYRGKVSKDKLEEYLDHYPKSVESVVKNAGFF